MKILWFTNSLPPDHAEAIGRPVTYRGGWLPALADALRADANEMMTMSSSDVQAKAKEMLQKLEGGGSSE